jgi:hypothetical protein
MNNVRIEKGNKKNRELTSSIVHFMLEQLELVDISIDIEFSNILRDEYALGFSSKNAENEFSIELDRNLDFHDLLETICHEMIHIKQYVRGELIEQNGQTIYKNILYNIDANDYYEDVDNLPWEKEAYEKETYYSKLYLTEVHNGTPFGRRDSSGFRET